MPARLTLSELQRIKRWQIAHRAEHPVEYHLWDAVLTLWVLGCVSWLPALALEMTVPVSYTHLTLPTSDLV